MANKKNLFSTALALRWQVFLLDFSFEDKRKCILQTMQMWNCAIKYGWMSFNKPYKWKKSTRLKWWILRWLEIFSNQKLSQLKWKFNHYIDYLIKRKLWSNSTKCHLYRFFIKSFNWCMLPRLVCPKGWNYVGIKTNLPWAKW